MTRICSHQASTRQKFSRKQFAVSAYSIDSADAQQIGAQWSARVVRRRAKRSARYQNKGCGVTHPHNCVCVFTYHQFAECTHDFQSGSHPTGRVSRASIQPVGSSGGGNFAL